MAQNRVTVIGAVSDPEGPSAGPVRFTVNCPHANQRTGVVEPCELPCVIEGPSAPAARKMLGHGKQLCLHGHLRDDDGDGKVLAVEQWQFVEPPAARE